MAGIQIDGVNNKIDFDDDLDTSISANTDDTLVIEAGGNTMATITATTFTINDGTTITTADNTDTLTLTSTDADATVGPNLRLYRNSASPADSDDIGAIRFDMRNDNSQDFTAAQITGDIGDVSDGTEDAEMHFDIMTAGTLREYLRLQSGNIIFNEGSQDIDFRVESNDRTSMLNVDAGLNKVGVGDVPDLGFLHVKVGDSGASVNTSHDTLVLEENGNSGISILSSTSNAGAICFGDSGNNCIGYINYNHANNAMSFGANISEKMRIHASGNVEIGATDDNSKFKVTSTTLGENVIRGFANGDYTSTVVVSSCDRNTTDGTYNHFTAVLTGVAQKFTVADSGNVTNTNNSYGAISDERLKSNIVDASSQWNDIKALKVRNYKRFDTDTTQLGVVAQELETANMNGLVQEKNPDEYEIKHNSAFGTLYTSDDAETKDGQDAVLYTADDYEVIEGSKNVGDVKAKATHSKKVGEIKEVKEKVKGVKYSVLYMKAIKALQEAQTRIETLETKVTALEG